jgi:hypothetical protein
LLPLKQKIPGILGNPCIDLVRGKIFPYKGESIVATDLETLAATNTTGGINPMYRFSFTLNLQVHALFTDVYTLHTPCTKLAVEHKLGLGFI